LNPLEAAIGIELMNKTFAERAGEPRKLLLINKYGAFRDYRFYKLFSKSAKNRVIFKKKHENFIRLKARFAICHSAFTNIYVRTPTLCSTKAGLSNPQS